MARVASNIALLSTWVLLLGCPSTSVYRTADPVEPGRWAVGAALGVGAMTDEEQDTGFPWAQMELFARRGITEDLDLGAKLYAVGAELNATWRLHQSTWSLALAPWVGGTRTAESAVTTNAAYVFAGSAAIASRRLSRRWTAAFGPHLGWGQYRPETGGSANGLWIGGFAHFDLAVGARHHLTPELGIYRVVNGEVPVRGNVSYLGLGWRWNL